MNRQLNKQDWEASSFFLNTANFIGKMKNKKLENPD